MSWQPAGTMGLEQILDFLVDANAQEYFSGTKVVRLFRVEGGDVSGMVCWKWIKGKLKYVAVQQEMELSADGAEEMWARIHEAFAECEKETRDRRKVAA